MLYWLIGTVVRSFLILAASLISAMPWGLPVEFVFALPLLVFAVIHDIVWRARDQVLIPVVFVAGLLVDILVNGPLGFWSFLFLLGFGMTRQLAKPNQPQQLLRRWTSYSLVALAITAIAWLVGSLYFLKLVAFLPMLFGAGLAAAIYPILSLLLGLSHVVITKPEVELTGSEA